jgi:hypothetical protein
LSGTENMQWLFNEISPLTDDGRNTVYDSFKDESKNLSETFVREFFQNFLDALQDGVQGRLSIRIVDSSEIDKNYNKEILKPLQERLQVSNEREGIPTPSLELENPRVLILEEYGTVGLTGKKEMLVTDKEDERWTNFWHGTAKRSKSGNKLGQAGQGKITYSMASKAQTILALTRPINEGKDFVFGKTSFRHTYNFEMEGPCQLFGHNGFWCTTGFDKNAFPGEDANLIDIFKKSYSLKRESETGISWVIPSVKDEITKEALIRATLKEFFVPIFHNKIDLDICGVKITQSNICDLIEEYRDEGMPSKEFFKFFQLSSAFLEKDFYKLKEDWFKDELTENDFDVDFKEIKDAFENRGCIGFRVPIEVSPKEGNSKKTFIKLWIQAREDEPRAECFYCRGSLIISDEPRGHKIPDKTSLMAFVLAEDKPVSTFLAKAEEASHLRWNQNQGGLNDYKKSQATLRNVRKVLKSIYGLLRTAIQERDEFALIDILSVPSGSGKKMKKSTPSKKKGKKGKEGKPREKIKKLEPFLLVEDGKGVRVKPGASATDEVNYPIKCTLVAAYHNIEIAGDSYKNYHPHDFDFNESFRQVTVETKNIKINERDQNEIKFEINSKDFLLELKGFRPDRQIRSKVGYTIE